MVGKGTKKGSVRFSLQAGDTARSVQVAGSFSNWKPVTMRKQKDGSYVATVAMTPGSHEYKFVVDGQWIVDPDNNAWALNAFGTLNSVVAVDSQP